MNIILAANIILFWRNQNLNLMHKPLLLLIIFFISFTVKAQVSQVGKWTPACYYDTNNSRICGEIKWDVPARNIFKGAGDHIQFRTADSVKKEKISTNKIRAFVIKADSFVVSHHPDLKEYPVLNVMLDNPIKLYVNLRENSTPSTMGTGNYTGITVTVGYWERYNTRYFYGENPDNITELSRGKFIEVMSKIMADNKGIVQAINNKEYRYGKIDELVKQYKIFKEHPIE
ncbi:MAG: hypothetical protein JWR05_1750 [Mucilaginibacter sp.]|nr:hypothetical protein [Mucilaginibacter sp.]